MTKAPTTKSEEGLLSHLESQSHSWSKPWKGTSVKKKIVIKYAKNRALKLELELKRTWMITMTEAQQSGYVRTACEAAGYEILTSKPASKEQDSCRRTGCLTRIWMWFRQLARRKR